MKQVLIKGGKAVIGDVPAPSITDENDVLIKTRFSLISRGTELTALKFSSENLLEKAKRRPDAVVSVLKEVKEKGVKSAYNKVIDQLDYLIGHESGYSISGEVIEVGHSVVGIKPGDFVCAAGAKLANHAEINVVPKNLVVKIPEGVDLRDAASTTVGAIALQSVRQAHPHIGDYVCVIGLGLVGLITVQILKANGCIVVGIDPDKNRRELAKELGANYVFNSKEANEKTTKIANGKGVDSTIIAASTNSSEPLQQAMEVTRKKGKVVILGIIGKNLQQSPFFQKEIEILVSTSYGPGRYDPDYEKKNIDYPYAYVRWTENRNMQAYLGLLSEGKIKLDKLIYKNFPLKKADAAFASLDSPDNPIMIFLEYSDKKKIKIDNVMSLDQEKTRKKINVAMIGAGWIAKDAHLPVLRENKHMNIYMVVDRKPVNATKTAKFFKANKSATSFDVAVNDKKVDSLIIATRHDQHARQIVEGFKNNKSIFIEKPIVLKRKELEDVKKAYKKYKKPLMAGYNRRFSPYTQQAFENISERVNPILIKYRVNAGFRELNNWLQDPNVGGGLVLGEMCHFFDFFNYMTGSKPVKINANALKPNTEDITYTDNVVVNVEYEDGSLCSLLYTGMGNKKLPKERVEIYSGGNVNVIDDFRELKVYGDGVNLKVGLDKGFSKQMEKWGSYLTGNSEIPISFEESILATEMCFDVMDQLKTNFKK